MEKKMDERYRAVAKKAISVICSSCVINSSALESMNETLLVANHLATLKFAAELIDEFEVIEADEGICDLAESLGVRVDA